MPAVLITGANRGLGLEFARRYADAGWDVIGTARDPDGGDELRQVARVEPLDVSDLGRVASFGDVLDGRPLDLFIANAGTYGPRRIETAADGEGWLETLNVMAVSPVLLAEALLPNLRAAKGKAVAITSKMGSIDDNNSGGFIAYRSAKAALNAAWTSLSIDQCRQRRRFRPLPPGLGADPDGRRERAAQRRGQRRRDDAGDRGPQARRPRAVPRLSGRNRPLVSLAFAAPSR